MKGVQACSSDANSKCDTIVDEEVEEICDPITGECYPADDGHEV